MRRLATLSLVLAAAACTFDGLDAYDQADAGLDATLDVNGDVSDAGPLEANAGDDGAADAGQDACANCAPIECVDAGTCIGPAQVCCAQFVPFTDGGILGSLENFACVPAGQCGGSLVAIQCSGKESCAANQVCCGRASTFNHGQGGSCAIADQTICRTACGTKEFIVGCDASSDCADGGACIVSQCTLPSYSICN